MKLLNIIKKLKSRVRKISWDGDRSTFVALGEELHSYVLRFSSIRKCAKIFVPKRETDKIVFLCGCFNSGTTILRDILGSHSGIKIIPREGVVYTSLLSDYEINDWARSWCSSEQIRLINEKEFAELSSRTLLSDWRFWLPKDGWFLEKSIANLGRMIELQGIFTKAHFIVISRDPLPVVEGITRRTKALVDNPEGVYSDVMALDQWQLCQDLVGEQIGSLKHCHQLRYENFISEPDVEINKILEFLKLAPIATYEGANLKIGNVKWEIRDGNCKSLNSMDDNRIVEINRWLDSNAN